MFLSAVISLANFLRDCGKHIRELNLSTNRFRNETFTTFFEILTRDGPALPRCTRFIFAQNNRMTEIGYNACIQFLLERAKVFPSVYVLAKRDAFYENKFVKQT